MTAKKNEGPAHVVTPRPRELAIPLEFPVTHEGTEITEIRVKRVTVGDIQDYAVKQREAADAGTYILPPVIDCSVDVWKMLDQDDATNIEEAALGFFPRVLRESLESLESEEPSGELS